MNSTCRHRFFISRAQIKVFIIFEQIHYYKTDIALGMALKETALLEDEKHVNIYSSTYEIISKLIFKSLSL